MKSSFVLPLLKDGVRFEDCIILRPKIPPWHLDFSSPIAERLLFPGGDLFECLFLVRLYLERRVLMVCCNGAQEAAWASSMARDMGGGARVYLTKLGTPAKLSDLVWTLDEAPVHVVVSVGNQCEFHKNWLMSLDSL